MTVAPSLVAISTDLSLLNESTTSTELARPWTDVIHRRNVAAELNDKTTRETGSMVAGLNIATEPQPADKSRRFIVGAILVVVALNVLAATVRDYGALQITATAILLIAVYPAVQFLRGSTDNFP